MHDRLYASTRYKRAPIVHPQIVERLMRRLNFVAATLLAASCVLMVAAPAQSQTQTDPATAMAADEAYRAALDAYLYFYPLVTMDLTRRQATHTAAGQAPGRGPINTFTHSRTLPDADYKDVVRPSFDMLPSTAWLDLSEGPIVISVPDTKGRYYALSLVDMWTDVFAVIGKRTTGTGRANYAIVPPGWSGTIPQGMRRLDATTAMVWANVRIQANSPIDYKIVHGLQDGFLITPLALWNRPSQSFQIKSDPGLDPHTPPLDQVEKMPAEVFFNYAAELSRKHPPHATDQPMLARLRRLNFNYGQQLNFSKLDRTAQQVLRRAARDANQIMHDKRRNIAPVRNGWQMDTDLAGVYGNAYLKRAINAQTRLGEGLPEDVVTLLLLNDANGEPLDGSQRYVLRFEPDEFPPASALWSLTMYDAQGFQSANALNRFSLGQRNSLNYNPDGSLELYLQHDDPGPADRANWLPAPQGPLSVTLRIYDAHPSVLHGEWTPPAVTRVDADLHDNHNSKQL